MDPIQIDCAKEVAAILCVDRLRLVNHENGNDDSLNEDALIMRVVM